MRRVAQICALMMGALSSLVLWLNVASATRYGSGQNKNTAQDATSASELFARNCAKCHGKDGRAKTFRGKLSRARDLTDAEWQAKVSDERIFNSIMNGRGKMPSYDEKFSSTQIEALVAHVRSLKK
jgi:cbb3-type cytochrome c oxidase subunit III